MFKERLQVLWDDLEKSKDSLYLVNDAEFNLLRTEKGNALDQDRGIAQKRIERECDSSWKTVESRLEKLRELEVYGDATSFYVSESWLPDLESGANAGDTWSIADDYATIETTQVAVDNAFPSLPVERRGQIANRVFSLKNVCSVMFSPNRDPMYNSDVINMKIIQDVQNRVVGQDIFRERPAYSETGQRFAKPDNIKNYLDVLIQFVQEKYESTRYLKGRLLLSVFFFDRFLYIHPFKDGNGRTARLLLSHMMRDYATVPISFYSRTLFPLQNNRQLYLASIRAGVKTLARYVLECLSENARQIDINFYQDEEPLQSSPRSVQEDVKNEVVVPEVDLNMI